MLFRVKCHCLVCFMLSCVTGVVVLIVVLCVECGVSCVVLMCAMRYWCDVLMVVLC